MRTDQPAPTPGADFDVVAQIIRQLVVEKIPARTLAAGLGVTEAQLTAHTIQTLQDWTANTTMATGGWADLSATIDGLTEVLETRQVAEPPPPSPSP